MSEVYFWSDTDFFHRKIILYSKRYSITSATQAEIDEIERTDGKNIDFRLIREMNESMIERHNSIVKQNDTVYHLGDFSFAKDPRDSQTVLNRLNGTKNLIKGNHDGSDTLGLRGWNSIKDYDEVKLTGWFVVLHHYAQRIWNKSRRDHSIHLYGHSHGNLPGNSKSLDVGVDCWDYKPVHIEEIVRRMRTLPKFTGYGYPDNRGDHHTEREDL